MTVQNALNKHAYDGDDSTTIYPYGFRVFSENDLEVYVDGAPQSVNTHYTVTNIGHPDGGNVEFITSANPDYDYTPGIGEANVVILRQLSMTQGVDLVQYGRYDAEVIEQAFDRLTMLAQQLSEQLGRTLTVSVTDSPSGMDVPSPAPGKVMVWNIDGNGLDNSEYTLDELTVSASNAATDAIAAADAAALSESHVVTLEGSAQQVRDELYSLTTQMNSLPYGSSGYVTYDANTGELNFFLSEGPVGPQGAEGPQGVSGNQGSQGPQGITGLQGLIGDQGPQGTQGVIGPDGQIGPQGTAGPQGITGPDGPMGATALGLAFGRFGIDAATGQLQVEYYGSANDQDFSINSNGELEVTI